MTTTLNILDEWLALTTARTMFSADEIQDFMLDLRNSIRDEQVDKQEEPALT